MKEISFVMVENIQFYWPGTFVNIRGLKVAGDNVYVFFEKCSDYITAYVAVSTSY